MECSIFLSFTLGYLGVIFALMVLSDLRGRRVYEEHYGRRIPAMARGPQKGVLPALQLIGLTVSYKGYRVGPIFQKNFWSTITVPTALCKSRNSFIKCPSTLFYCY